MFDFDQFLEKKNVRRSPSKVINFIEYNVWNTDVDEYRDY